MKTSIITSLPRHVNIVIPPLARIILVDYRLGALDVNLFLEVIPSPLVWATWWCGLARTAIVLENDGSNRTLQDNSLCVMIPTLVIRVPIRWVRRLPMVASIPLILLVLPLLLLRIPFRLLLIPLPLVVIITVFILGLLPIIVLVLPVVVTLSPLFVPSLAPFIRIVVVHVVPLVLPLGRTLTVKLVLPMIVALVAAVLIVLPILHVDTPC